MNPLETLHKAIDAIDLSRLDVRQEFGTYSWRGNVLMTVEACGGQIKAAMMEAAQLIILADRIRNAQKAIDKGGNGQAVIDAVAAYDKARE